MAAWRAPVAFDGVSFVSGGATVLVEDGLIVGVERFGCDLPADCPVHDYSGTLLPGLIDAHVHLVADLTGPALTATADPSEPDHGGTEASKPAEEAASAVDAAHQD